MPLGREPSVEIPCVPWVATDINTHRESVDLL